MKKVKKRQETQRAVTARFTYADFSELTVEAEKRGTTIADMIRISWSSYQKQQDIKQLFSRLEIRLIRQMFEVCSVTAGLNEIERADAMTELKERMEKLRK